MRPSTAPALELQAATPAPFDLARPLETPRAHTDATEKPEEDEAAPSDGNDEPVGLYLVHGLVNQVIINFLVLTRRRGILSHGELDDTCDLRHGQL